MWSWKSEVIMEVNEARLIPNIANVGNVAQRWEGPGEIWRCNLKILSKITFPGQFHGCNLQTTDYFQTVKTKSLQNIHKQSPIASEG